MPDRDTQRSGWARYAPRYPRQLGHSGRMLALLGFMWVVMGSTMISSGPRELPRFLEGVIFPTAVGGWIWIVTGLVALIVAWRPPGRGGVAFGWTALYFMPAVRFIGNLTIFIEWLIPSGDRGHPFGLHFSLIYLTMTGVVYICSDWPDPTPLPTRVLERSYEEDDDVE